MKCWNCGAEAPAGDLCPECGRLQPFLSGADHWTVLGLPRRLVLDHGELEGRFHELNRRFHPDYFRLRAPEEQAISLESSAAVNTAYRVLRDPVARLEYLLELEGVALGSSGRARPPADLFEEIMELQEVRQELATADPGEEPGLRARLEAARTEFAGRRVEAEAAFVGLFPRWDVADDGARRRLLSEMRDALATRAYLRTLLRDLDASLGRTD